MFKHNKKRNLPQAKGPYAPGCIDIMLEYAESGIFSRLYYPTNEKNYKVDTSKWISWIPTNNYFVGAAMALLHLPIFARLVYWIAIADTLSPILYGAKVKKSKKLPCIVLSHGYSANRLFYSNVCSELASFGYLVAVIEHRDESSGYTYFYKTKEDASADIKMPMYIKILPFDERFYTERNKQVQYRANECSKLLDLLIDLNNGRIPYNVLKDLNNEQDINFNWGDFEGLLDLSTLTMAGHSFGGATALHTLSIRKEFKQGILMDPWIFPIKYEEKVLQNVTQPLIFINSQTFHTSVNCKEMEKYLDGDKRTMYTILHTTHEIQSDIGFILGFWMNLFTKKLDPLQAADINNGLLLRFLKQYTGNTESIEDYEVCLQKEDKNIVSGLTKPWTIIAN